MISRRFVLAAGGAALTVGSPRAQTPRAPAFGGLGGEIARIESETGGRLGVCVRDSASGATSGYRAEERFPLCSTFKVLAAAALLARVDAGREKLDRLVTIAPGDLVDYSPITVRRVGADGMSLSELCEAAITVSDNTAGNLLLAAIGGPAGLTAFVRTLGDGVTRLDRNEPTLNEALPGDPRDTTSPAAMAGTLDRLLLGDALAAGSRRHLADWMLANTTGNACLRAGMPAGWRVADKTGSGEHGTRNDVGILWPPRGAPVTVAVYLTDTIVATERRNAAIAQVAGAVAAAS